MIEIHILKKDLKCNKFKLGFKTLKLFNENNCSIVLPFIDNKKINNKTIYRACLCINKNFVTNYHSNPLNLKLFVFSVFGDIAINDKFLKKFYLYSFNYNEKIKISSKKNISFFILLRKINFSHLKSYSLNSRINFFK